MVYGGDEARCQESPRVGRGHRTGPGLRRIWKSREYRDTQSITVILMRRQDTYVFVNVKSVRTV